MSGVSTFARIGVCCAWDVVVSEVAFKFGGVSVELRNENRFQKLVKMVVEVRDEKESSEGCCNCCLRFVSTPDNCQLDEEEADDEECGEAFKGTTLLAEFKTPKSSSLMGISRMSGCCSMIRIRIPLT